MNITDFLSGSPFLTFVTRLLNVVHIVTGAAATVWGTPENGTLTKWLAFAFTASLLVNEYLKTLIPPSVEAAQKALNSIKLPK